MSTSFTGVRVVETRPELIDQLYQARFITTDFDNRYKFFPNEYVVVKDYTKGQQSAITRVMNDRLVLLKDKKKYEASNVCPRNKEQLMALDALIDDAIKVCVLTGRAGTGKTLLTLAAALHKFDKKKYDRIILTRPMSWVGRHGLGALPGDVDEKFGPYLENYICNIEHMLNSRRSVSDLIAHYNMQFIPLQLIRGASWPNTFVIADEVQVLGHDEMVALGTRVGEGSKIVIMGDLGQRDEAIPKEKTGLYKLINDQRMKESNLVSAIELIKCERSEVANLFADVFER